MTRRWDASAVQDGLGASGGAFRPRRRPQPPVSARAAPTHAKEHRSWLTLTSSSSAAGIVGLGTALALAPRVPRSPGGHRGRALDRHAPDRPQQRRHPLRPLLRARLAEGDAVRRGPRGAVPLLRGARRPPRALRQGRRRHRRGASSGVSSTLRQRGEANGLRNMRCCRASELRELEPHAEGVAALHVEETGIVNYGAVSAAYAQAIARQGGQVETRARLLSARRARRRDRRRDHAGHGPARVPWSTARGCIRTAWRGRAASNPTCASCRSAASTTTSRREPASREAPHLPGARPALPVPRRPLHHDASRATSKPARTPCWRCARGLPLLAGVAARRRASGSSYEGLLEDGARLLAHRRRRVDAVVQQGAVRAVRCRS